MATSNITELRLEPGLWRPDAAVLCLSCHEKRAGGLQRGFGTAGDFDPARFTERPIDDVDGWSNVGQCDDCRKKIWIDCKIALEQEVVHVLQEKGYAKACMSQTGGMCSAAELPLDADEDGGYKHIWITADDDADDFDRENPKYIVGFLFVTQNDDIDEEEYEGPLVFDNAIALVERLWREK